MSMIALYTVDGLCLTGHVADPNPIANVTTTSPDVFQQLVVLYRLFLRLHQGGANTSTFTIDRMLKQSSVSRDTVDEEGSNNGSPNTARHADRSGIGDFLTSPPLIANTERHEMWSFYGLSIGSKRSTLAYPYFLLPADRTPAVHELRGFADQSCVGDVHIGSTDAHPAERAGMTTACVVSTERPDIRQEEVPKTAVERSSYEEDLTVHDRVVESDVHRSCTGRGEKCRDNQNRSANGVEEIVVRCGLSCSSSTSLRQDVLAARKPNSDWLAATLVVESSRHQWECVPVDLETATGTQPDPTSFNTVVFCCRCVQHLRSAM